MVYALRLAAMVVLVSGIVLAIGFWSTLIAVFFPLWAWYLAIERALHMAGAF